MGKQINTAKLVEEPYIQDHPFVSDGDAKSPCVEEVDGFECGAGLFDHAFASLSWVGAQSWNGPVEKQVQEEWQKQYHGR